MDTLVWIDQAYGESSSLIFTIHLSHYTTFRSFRSYNVGRSSKINSLNHLVFRCISISSYFFVPYSLRQWLSHGVNRHQPQYRSLAYSNLTKAISVSNYKLLHPPLSIPLTVYGPLQCLHPLLQPLAIVSDP